MGETDFLLGNPLGLIYTLNFSTPFNTTQNISAVLGTLPKVSGGAASNLAPTYLDGALLGNNEEFCLFGGMPFSPAFSDSQENSVLCYQRHQYGLVRQDLGPAFRRVAVDPNTTYVAYGGAASAPSENLAWYFSGLRSPTGGKINIPGAGNATEAINVSSTLITMDMTTQGNETFTTNKLPSQIPGRASAELVWVPIGARGILVALGGVVYPDFASFDGSSSNETASVSPPTPLYVSSSLLITRQNAQSPSFMTRIDIYDVASGNWYNQTTKGGPGQLTRGCAVVAPAQDRSSFNIYYYGGYDGLHQTEPFSDNVWVLSLPSFTWVQLSNSTVEGRAGHKCVMPYPDQMLVIGGYPSLSGTVLACLSETIRVFNLSTGIWLDRYDPAVYAKYTVPDTVVKKIGGSGTGGATATTPSPAWDSQDLESVFASPYPTSKITNYYPYASIGPVDNTNPNASSAPVPDEGGGGGVPSYLPPVLGSVLGLVFITMVIVLILLWRRRRLLRGGMSEAGTEDTNGHRITSWLRGQPSEVKAPPTVTTASDYSPQSATDVESVAVDMTPRTIAEMMNTEVQLPAELPGTSPPTSPFLPTLTR